MFATDFEFDNKRLSDLGMMVMVFDKASDETISSGADIIFNQVKTSGSDIFNLYSSKYEEVFKATFQIGKNPCLCKTQDDMYLSPTEVSGLQRWLCQKRYCKFKVAQRGYENIYWNATFSSKQIMLNGMIIGLELSLFTNAPYAFQEEVTIKKILQKNEGFTLHDLSDEVGEIMPFIEVEFLETGDSWILENSMDINITEVKNVSANEVITFDGKNQIISSSFLEHKIADDFNYHFPIIGNTYDTNINEYVSNLDCKITIKYSPIIKVGL